MIRPDQGKFPIFQGLGENPEIYIRFGLKGHNGWDIACPLNTILVSPHDGTITEVANDPDGYGLYLKIENDAEASLLAHNNEILVKIGQHVDKMQSIVKSGNSGFSTGPHSHWGYFRKPRNRNNGFNGYIDPTPYFDSGIIPPIIIIMDDDHKRALAVLEDYRKMRQDGPEGNFEGYTRALIGRDEKFPSLNKDLENYKIANDNLKIANDQQVLLIEQIRKDLNSCLSKPTDAPKKASEAFTLLLRLLFSK